MKIECGWKSANLRRGPSLPSPLTLTLCICIALSLLASRYADRQAGDSGRQGDDDDEQKRKRGESRRKMERDEKAARVGSTGEVH